MSSAVERIPLKECCKLVADGNWIETKDQSDSGIRLIQTGNIGNGTYLNKKKNAKFISRETFDRLNCREVFPGDILVSRLPDPVGRACIVPDIGTRMITAVDCCILRVDDTVVQESYLSYYLQSADYYHQLEGKLTGTTRKRVSRKNLEAINAIVPNLETQSAISKTFDCIDKQLCRDRERLIYFDALVKSQFVEMFGTADDWEKSSGRRRLDSECWIGSSKRIFANEYVKNGVPFYRTKEIVELSRGEQPSTELFIENKRFQEIAQKNGAPEEGDLLISAVGTIGTIWVVDMKEPFYFKDGNLLWLRPHDNNPVYLKHLLEEAIRHSLDRVASGTAYKALTIQQLSRMEVLIPSANEQLEFASFVAQVDKSQFAVRQSIEQLEILKAKLMQEYFG